MKGIAIILVNLAASPAGAQQAVRACGISPGKGGYKKAESHKPQTQPPKQKKERVYGCFMEGKSCLGNHEGAYIVYGVVARPAFKTIKEHWKLKW